MIIFQEILFRFRLFIHLLLILGASSKSGVLSTRLPSDFHPKGVHIAASLSKRADVTELEKTLKRDYSLQIQSKVATTSCQADIIDLFNRLFGGAINGDDKSYTTITWIPNAFDPSGAIQLTISLPAGHMIVHFDGPNDGWNASPEKLDDYSKIQNDYHKLLWVLWNIPNNKYQADNPTAGFTEFALNYITISALGNPTTLKIFLEAQSRLNYSPDEIFVVTAPTNNDNLNDNSHYIWNILIHTSEIGAVQNMLTIWPNKFNGLKITKIGIRLQGGNSQDAQEATIILYLSKAGEGRTSSVGADEKTEVSSLFLIKAEIDIFQFPAREAFDGSTLVDEMFWLSAQNQPTYQRKHFKWNGNQDMIQVATSGRDRLLLIENQIFFSEEKELARFLWEIWQKTQGGTYLRNIAFLEVGSRTNFKLEGVYDKKGVSYTESLNIFMSAEDRNMLYGYDADTSYLDEDKDRSGYQEISDLVEIRAIEKLISDTGTYIGLGQPRIASIEIGHRPAFKRIMRPKGAPIADYQFTLLIRLRDLDAMEIDSVERTPLDSDGFVVPDEAQAALVDPRFDGFLESMARATDKRTEMISVFSGVKLPGLRAMDDDEGALVQETTARSRITKPIKKYDIDKNIRMGSKAPGESDIVRGLINNYGSAIAQDGRTLLPLTKVPNGVKVTVGNFIMPGLKFSFLLYWDKTEKERLYSFIAVTGIPTTEGDGYTESLEDMFYLYFSAISNDRRLRYLALLQVSDNTARTLEKVFRFLDLTQDQYLLLNNWTEESGSQRKKALLAVLGTSELVAIQKLTIKYNWEPSVNKALVNDIYIRWSPITDKNPIRRPQILIKIAWAPKSNPELQRALALAEETGIVSRAPANGPDLRKAIQLGTNLVTEINVLRSFEINTGSLSQPVPIDETLNLSGALPVGISQAQPNEIRTIQTHLFPSIVKDPFFSGQIPDNTGYYHYNHISITSIKRANRAEGRKANEDYAKNYDKNYEENVEKNGWGFGVSLGFATIAIESDTNELQRKQILTIRNLWTKVYQRLLKEIDVKVPEKTRILLLVFVNLTPQMQDFKTFLLQKQISSKSCPPGKMFEIARTKPSDQSNPFEISEVGNSDWVLFLGIPEIGAIAGVGLDQKHSGKDWFLPDRGVIICRAKGSQPLVGVRLEYYSAVDGQSIKTDITS
ncbi:hypothetical protein TWF694_011502 [Orbilia ellipsospora]|uniref:Uncharacterized protein n=1 Tax=Orbilia ellipsospora TaxID=2528407 RepID=A0AAV9X6N4_9PEZI